MTCRLASRQFCKNSVSSLFGWCLCEFNKIILNVFPCVLFVRFFPDCLELDASISTENTFGASDTWPMYAEVAERIARCRSQDVRLYRNRIHGRHSISKSIDYQIENWFESVRQGFSWFIQTDWLRQVNIKYTFICNLSLLHSFWYRRPPKCVVSLRWEIIQEFHGHESKLPRLDRRSKYRFFFISHNRNWRNRHNTLANRCLVLFSVIFVTINWRCIHHIAKIMLLNFCRLVIFVLRNCFLF